MNTVSPVAIVYSLSVSFIFIWSLMRFGDVSTPYKNQIKIYWLVALIYAAYYLALFVISIMVLLLVSTEARGILGVYSSGGIKKILDGSPEFLPPLLSAALLYKAHEIRFFHRLDRFIVDRLLSAHHLKEDYLKLKNLLENNDFSPSQVEFSANLKMMEKFEVFVSNPLEEPPDLHSGDPITLWRKVSTLIRFCESCLNDDDSVRKEKLAQLRAEHSRRTGVALHLLRLKLSTESFQEFERRINEADLLQQASNQDNRVALILTSNELEKTTKQFSEYFITDYKKLITSVSEISAHLVIYSGSSAQSRLEQLTETGFKGLGSFKELSFHKVILLLMSVFLGALVLFYFHFSMNVDMEAGKELPLAIKIATVYAFSTLCGASIGSSRRLMQTKEIPWGWYLLAGLLGWLVWLTVAVAINFNPDLTQGSDVFANEVILFVHSLSRTLPWSIMPFVCAMGVAALVRCNPLINNLSGVNARIGDGIMMGFLMVLGLWITLMVHHGLKTDFSIHRLIKEGGLDIILILKMSVVSFVFAFVVGSTAIVIARRVANSGLEIEPEETD